MDALLQSLRLLFTNTFAAAFAPAFTLWATPISGLEIVAFVLAIVMVLLNMRVNEFMVHSWDVAKASGQSTDLDPELAAQCMEDFRRLRATGRGAGMFADAQEAPAGATAADQLAAVAGRTVG